MITLIKLIRLKLGLYTHLRIKGWDYYKLQGEKT